MRGFRKCSNQFQLRNFCHSKYYCIFPPSPSIIAEHWLRLGLLRGHLPSHLPSSYSRGFLQFFDPNGVSLPFSALHTPAGQKNISSPHPPPKKTCLQGSAKRWAPGCVNAADQTEVVSNSSNKIHQTWERLFAEPCTSREKEASFLYSFLHFAGG